MDRRNFFQQLLATGVLTSVGGTSSFLLNRSVNSLAKKFTLNYAPHIGMFSHLGGESVADQLHFIADTGFTAFEDNEMRSRPVAQQEKMAEIMQLRGLEMGVFVAHSIGWREPNLTTNDSALQKKFLKEIEDSVQVAKRVNATWMTVVPGRLHSKLEMGYQTSNVIEVLKRAANILEPHNLIMVLEPLNPLRDHPGQFLTKTSQAYEICKAVDSPACKILYDVYHQQITEGNLIPNIDYAWDEIAYFQVGDNPGRNEPSTGEINYKNLFSYLYERGYSGIIGMEHGNSMPGKEGEQAVINAYRKWDAKPIK